jgi:hypothetical protein
MKSVFNRSAWRSRVRSCTFTTSRTSRPSASKVPAWAQRTDRRSPSGRTICTSTVACGCCGDSNRQPSAKASTWLPSWSRLSNSSPSGWPSAQSCPLPDIACNAGFHTITRPVPSSTRMPSLDWSTTARSLLVSSTSRARCCARLSAIVTTVADIAVVAAKVNMVSRRSWRIRPVTVPAPETGQQHRHAGHVDHDEPARPGRRPGHQLQVELPPGPGHPGQEGQSPADLNKALRSAATVVQSQVKFVADIACDLHPLPR